MNYPSKTMTDSNICTDSDNFLDNNIITKINNTLQDNNDMIYVNIMKRINYIASMFSTMEHMYNNKNKYNFGYLPYYLYSTIIKDKEQLKNMDKNGLNTYIDNLSYKYLYKCYDYNYSVFDQMKIKILILCLLFNFDNKENILIDLINYNNFNNSIYNLYILYNDINKFLADNNIDNDIKFRINIIFNYMFDILYNQNEAEYKILNIIINNYLINIFKNINKIDYYLNNIILNFNVSILSSEINGDFNILKYIDDIENNLNGKIISIINQQDIIIEKNFNNNIISIIDQQDIQENIIDKNEIFEFFLSIKNPNNPGNNINIFQPSILYKNRLNKELLFNYIYTSIYMYGNNKIPANENYDKYIGRQHEFLLSNIYSDLIDSLIITDNQTNYRNIIYSDNNIVIYHSINDTNILLKICTHTLQKSFLNDFCKDKYNDCKIHYDEYNIETDILNKLYIDSEYIFCKITNDVNKLINICYLIDSENFDKLIQALQNYYNITIQKPENFNDKLKLTTYIDIIKNYCFLFKPLQHLERYYSNNINKYSNDIYVERYNIKNIYNNKIIKEPNTSGDLYSIFNGNFFIIDSKFKKDPNMCSIIKTLSQTYLYMNAYYNPLCTIKNIDKISNYKNSLYKTYYLCYINSFTNDLIYLEYENFYNSFHSKIKNYHFSTRIQKYKDEDVDNTTSEDNDDTTSSDNKQTLNITKQHINTAYKKYIENNNNITNSTTFNEETCQTILNNNNENLSKYKQILDDYYISDRQLQSKKERALYACCKLKNQHDKCNNKQIKCKEDTMSTINKSISLINKYNENNNNSKKSKAEAIIACQYMMYKDNELYNICKQKGIHSTDQNKKIVGNILKQNTK